MEIQKQKGTYDVLNDYSDKLIILEKFIFAICEKYNYKYIRTPIFEATELFHRGMGDSTDVVTKETYDFTDRGGRLITLRPEGTAGVVRSYIENKLYTKEIQKLFYYGPMYRYERPQAGRYREFYQFGVEVFGSSSPYIDAEVISMPVNLYKMLGLKDVTVNINSMGTVDDRTKYKKALIDYFKPHINSLCDDCSARFQKNPMRIIDCKVDSENEIIKNAPKITDYLSAESKNYFENVLKCLDDLGIKYVKNPNIVRGLDYYTHTVFEITVDAPYLGNQNVLGGGGRYDDLVSMLSGPNTPGVGLAIGIERLMEVLMNENPAIFEPISLDLFILAISDEDKPYVSKMCQNLRLNGFSVDIDYLSKSLKGQFKLADNYNSKFIVIVGENERKTGKVTIKNNITKEEKEIKVSDIVVEMDSLLG